MISDLGKSLYVMMFLRKNHLGNTILTLSMYIYTHDFECTSRDDKNQHFYHYEANVFVSTSS